MILFKDLILRISKEKNIPSSLINIFLLINWKKKNIFHIFKDTIIDEEFITENDKEILKDLYISVKNHINKLNSFSRNYKFKKSVKYDINTDLHLNSLELIPDKEKIMIIENNTLYNFKLRDLISCWKLALLNSQGLFAKPIHVKNPYTNLPISVNNLYNIYFKCLNIYVNIPMCITIFFKCNMDIGKFSSHYYTTLKEVAIINFINANNYYELFEQTLNLLHDHRKLVNYITFTTYCSPSSRVKAIKLFKPLLLNYLLSKFSCNPIVKEQKLNILKKQLKDLVSELPNFGFERGFDVMRYIPISERPRRTQPPPPPPNLINNIISRRLRQRRQTRTSAYSDSDDSSDIEEQDEQGDENNNLQNTTETVTETVPETDIEMATINVSPTPNPITNIIIPPPPPPIVNILPPAPVIINNRPINPPPPPPIDTITNPFVASRQLARTPVRNRTQIIPLTHNNNNNFNTRVRDINNRFHNVYFR